MTQKVSVDNKAKYLPLQIWRCKSNFSFLGHTTVTLSSDKLKKKNNINSWPPAAAILTEILYDFSQASVGRCLLNLRVPMHMKLYCMCVYCHRRTLASNMGGGTEFNFKEREDGY